jgi:hypothetical protein
MKGELGSASRALLDAAREGMSPDAAAIARVRAKVGASIGGATIAGSLAGKLGVLGLVVALATGAVLLRRDPEVPSFLPNAVDEQPRTSRDQPTQIVAREEMPDREPIAMPPMIVSRPPAAATPDPAPRVAAARHVDLRREVELIDQAMAAMKRGDAATALAAVRTHALETAGTGQLAEDATAIEVEALCKLHDPRVGEKLAAFDERWPDSAQRSRLTTSCH